VQAVIESRLAQLSEAARELIGVAATIGREFTSDVLGYALEADEDTLVRGLDELWQRRIVREQGADSYDFSHDRIREVVYEALSPVRRRHHHLRIAEALTRHAARDPGAVSGQVAGHYERAGVADRAVTWYERAAEAAQGLHANAEAVRLLYRALDLLSGVPASPERDARELGILTALPGSLVAVEGYASSRLTDVHRRAAELAHELGVEPAAPLLRSLALVNLSNGDFVAAGRAGEQLRDRSERDRDDVLRVEAEYVLGIAAFWRGELGAAQEHFEVAVERYRSEHRRTHLLRYGQDPKVVCLGRLAITLWLAGRAQAAARTGALGLALAEEIGDPYTSAIARVFAAVLALEMRDPDLLRRHVAALKANPSEREARQNQIVREAFEGYLDVLDGRAEAGIARIERALDDVRHAVPAPGHEATIGRVLLAAGAAAGDARTGLAATDRALDAGDARVWEAEARRLRAEFLAALSAPASDVEAEFARARAVARRQGAGTLELRAAVSLLRYRLARGDGEGARLARESLAVVLDALPERTETPDLREASRLGEA
jgi:hypothetical protein